jgi:adenylate cyclase
LCESQRGGEKIESQAQPPRLLLSEPRGERQVPLDVGSTWRIGRTPENDVVLPADSVSRNHAMIQLTDSLKYYLIDLGSVNGSFVNGTRVSVPKALKDGDQIRIGENTLTFRRGDAHADTKTAESPTYVATRVLYVPRLITVLVVDIRDFTKLTQQVDQSVLCQAIGTWFRRGGGIMQARGSWAIKYIGDAIMAVWLHQKTGEEQQEILDILRAYVELAAASASLASEFSLPAFRIGAGINTGMASIGNAGGSGIEDFTAMGDAVNAAFRIESATKETGVDVAIGRNTCDWLPRSFQPEAYFRPYQVKLKGYDVPADLWGADLETAQRFLSSASVT